MSSFPLNNFRIKRTDREIEPQEVLLDAFSRKNKEAGVSERKLEVPISPRIILDAWIGILLLFFVIFLRTFQLQVIDGKTFSDLSEKNRFVVKTIKAERGVIYDNNFVQLVSNKPSFNFICDDKTVIENVEHDVLLKLETNIEDYPGCIIENNTVRDYKLPVKIILFNNQCLGLVRQIQEFAFCSRYVSTRINSKVNFVKIAQAYGLEAFCVTRPQDLEAAWKQAMRKDKLPIGLFYQQLKPSYHEQVSELAKGPLVNKDIFKVNISQLLAEFK